MNLEISAQSARRTDLDWIRVIAVLLLVPFHSALIFDLKPYAVMYIKDSTDSSFFDWLAGWIHQFHMPILFFVAGAASFFALKKRSNGEYLKERLYKLLIPAIAAIVLLVPPMTYITAVSKGNAGSFGLHFMGFWHLNASDLNGISGSFTPAHLWFLFFLAFFSFVALPLFTLLKVDKVRMYLRKSIDTIGVLGFIVILIVVSTLAAKTNILGSINPIYYFTIFLAGYIFMVDERFQSFIDKLAPYLLGLSIACELTRQLLFGDIYALTQSGNLLFTIEQLNRWLWMLCFLGFAHRFVTGGGKVLRYLSSASFPFYIFHLLVNTIVGYFVIKSSLCIGLKYLLIVVATTLSTLVVYQIVQQIPGVRFLFGIHKK